MGESLEAKFYCCYFLIVYGKALKFMVTEGEVTIMADMVRNGEDGFREYGGSICANNCDFKFFNIHQPYARTVTDFRVFYSIFIYNWVHMQLSSCY